MVKAYIIQRLSNYQSMLLINWNQQIREVPSLLLFHGISCHFPGLHSQHVNSLQETEFRSCVTREILIVFNAQTPRIENHGRCKSVSSSRIVGNLKVKVHNVLELSVF